MNKRVCPRHTLGPRLMPYTALADTAMGVARHVCVQSVGQEDGEGVHLQQGLRGQELFGVSKTRESLNPGVGDGQGGLVCCDSWGRKKLDMTERLI